MVSMVKRHTGPDGELLHWCPNHRDWYEPKYENKHDAPQGTIEREQHITGICSDECWDEYLGVSPS